MYADFAVLALVHCTVARHLSVFEIVIWIGADRHVQKRIILIAAVLWVGAKSNGLHAALTCLVGRERSGRDGAVEEDREEGEDLDRMHRVELGSE